MNCDHQVSLMTDCQKCEEHNPKGAPFNGYRRCNGRLYRVAYKDGDSIVLESIQL